MAPKALLLVADGSEEIEFVTPYDGKCFRFCLRQFDGKVDNDPEDFSEDVTCALEG